MTSLFKSLLLGLLVGLPAFVLAANGSGQEYVLLEPLPGFEKVGQATSLGSYVNRIYEYAIMIGAALAVSVIVRQGFTAMFSDSVSARTVMRERISMTLGGLALLLSAFIILRVINPDLTNLDFQLNTLTAKGDAFSLDITVNNSDVPTRTYSEAERAQFAQYPTTYAQNMGLNQPAAGPLNDPFAGSPLTPTEQDRINFYSQFAPYTTLNQEQRQELFTLAARIEGLPTSWGSSADLFTILDKESASTVGILNWTITKAGFDRSFVYQEIRADRFYKTICPVIIDKEIYKYNGKFQCSSATGLGQLIIPNVKKYYPSGVAGVGIPLEEARGMLRCIAAAPGSPSAAAAAYVNGVGYACGK